MTKQLNIDELQNLIGEETTDICPNCRKGFLLKNKEEDIWCSECDYSNNPDLSDFIKSLLNINHCVGQVEMRYDDE